MQTTMVMSIAVPDRSQTLTGAGTTQSTAVSGRPKARNSGPCRHRVKTPGLLHEAASVTKACVIQDGTCHPEPWLHQTGHSRRQQTNDPTGVHPGPSIRRPGTHRLRKPAGRNNGYHPSRTHLPNSCIRNKETAKTDGSHHRSSIRTIDRCNRTLNARRTDSSDRRGHQAHPHGRSFQGMVLREALKMEIANTQRKPKVSRGRVQLRPASSATRPKTVLANGIR